MLFIKRILVGDLERVFVIRKGRLAGILGPGEYWVFGLGVVLEKHSVRELVLDSTWADYLATERPDLVADYFRVVETRDFEVAAVYLDRKLARVIGPGKRVLFWRGPVEVTAEVIDAKAEPQAAAPSVERPPQRQEKQREEHHGARQPQQCPR